MGRPPAIEIDDTEFKIFDEIVKNVLPILYPAEISDWYLDGRLRDSIGVLLGGIKGEVVSNQLYLGEDARKVKDKEKKKERKISRNSLKCFFDNVVLAFEKGNEIEKSVNSEIRHSFDYLKKHLDFRIENIYITLAHLPYECTLAYKNAKAHPKPQNIFTGRGRLKCLSLKKSEVIDLNKIAEFSVLFLDKNYPHFNQHSKLRSIAENVFDCSLITYHHRLYVTKRDIERTDNENEHKWLISKSTFAAFCDRVKGIFADMSSEELISHTKNVDTFYDLQNNITEQFSFASH